MATKSLVCRYSGDIETAQIEYRLIPVDGDVFHTGTTLIHYYNTNKDLDILFDCVNCDTVIEPEKMSELNENAQRWTDLTPETVVGLKELKETVKDWCDYCYIFNIDTEEWSMLYQGWEYVENTSFKRIFLREWHKKYYDCINDNAIERIFEEKRELFGDYAEHTTEYTLQSVADWKELKKLEEEMKKNKQN